MPYKEKKMKKTWITAVLCLSVLTTMTGTFVKADDTVQEESILEKYEHQHREVGEAVYREAASAFSGGDGSESAPYEISSAEELQYLANLLAEDALSDYRGKHYILTADISLNDVSGYENWGEERPAYDWKPIGTKAAFTGVFDGNGHVISGLYLNRDIEESNEEDSADYGGLFAYVYQGTIKNLNLTEVYIEVSGERSRVGGIAGMASKTQIFDCTVDGKLIGYDGYYGGIAGNASGTISGCTFAGTVSAAKDLQNGQNGQAYLGGIAGDFSSAIVGTGDESADAFEGITNCINKGTIEIENGCQSALAAGGIAGTNSARITGCTNEGTVEAKAAAEEREELGTSALSIGGIAGSFVVAVLGEDGVIRDCENTGTVVADSANTGGIVGTIDLADPRYAVTIENCKNTGKVFSANHYYAGIAADAAVKADNTLTIANCTNEADFTEGEGAGIVYELVMQKGKMLLSGNANHGKIFSSGQNAAGILCYTANMGDDWQLDLENCENTADITSEGNVGGIAGFTAYYKTDTAATSFSIQNCKNSGNLSSSTTNGYIGGILAVDGFMQTQTVIDGCENSGKISFTDPWVMGEPDLKTENDEGEKEDASLFTLSVMGGGIVGRIGEAVLLSVDADQPDGQEINKKDALVLISNCVNTGDLSYEEPKKGDGVTEEEFQKAAETYWKASMGGILGDCSCTNGYSVNFENCTYRTERGIGNTELPDIE